MKYKYYPQESKIYDFLNFPKCLYFKHVLTREIDHYQEIVVDEYIDFIQDIEKKLKPYSQEIEVFYHKDSFNDYDFIDLISHVHTPFYYKNEKDYLEMMLKLDEKVIRKYIIYSIIDNNLEYESNKEEIMKKVNDISSSHDETITFIKELSIDNSIKWNLFLFVEEPVKYMKMYVELMKKLKPIFDDIYQPLKEEINRTGNDLVSYLNSTSGHGIKELTNSLLDETLLEGKYKKILISVIFSYSITITSVVENKYIVWGLKMEEALKKLKEINENKTNERVRIFKNLGDKTRYEVLKLIASGITSTKEIASRLGVSSATISYHINAFITSKVIKMNSSQKKFDYVVDYQLLNETLEEFKEDLMFPKD